MNTAYMVEQRCSHCGKQLTDTASRECGIGPVCRGKNNYLYSKTIEVKAPLAVGHVLAVSSQQLPEPVQKVWHNTQSYFIRRMRKIENDGFVVSGADLRNVVETIDFILSFNVDRVSRQNLIAAVEAMGYVGLAAVLNGAAAMGKAKVYFEEGYLYLKGTSNKRGWLKMRRIPGIRTPRYRGDKTPYRASWRHAEAFLNIVRKYWPIHDEDLGDIQKQCEEWGQNHPMDENEAAVEDNQAAVFNFGGLGFTVKLPWKGTREEMMSTISKLKEVPHKDRSFNPQTKEWTFKHMYWAKVRGAVSERYKVVQRY